MYIQKTANCSSNLKFNNFFSYFSGVSILNDKHVDDFYKNVNDFAHNWSSNRGNTSGVKKGTRNVLDNPHIMTNIFGYFDKWSPRQKFVFNKRKEKPLVDVRVCKFNMDTPEKYEKTIPLLEQNH